MAKKKTIKINFEGVETGTKTLPEGSYVVKVSSVEVKSSSNNTDYLAFTFEVVEGKYKKSKLFHNCSLQPQALFNLKTVLLALQYEMDSVEFDLDLDMLVDLECEVEVIHEMYEGKKKARIVEFSCVDDDIDNDDDLDDDEEEDDEEEDDEEEDEEEDDLEELSLKELKEKAKSLGIKTKGVDKEDLIELIEEALEEEDEEEEEEEELDLEELSLKELKSLAKEKGIKVKKGMDKEDIIELIEDAE